MQERGNNGVNRRRVWVLSVVVPLAGLLSLYLLNRLLLRVWPQPLADGVVALLMIAGVGVFSWAIFRVILQQDRHLAHQHDELVRRYETERRLRAQVEAVHQAALVIASARTAPDILRRLVDLARDLIGAQYAALDVLDLHGGVGVVYTSGDLARRLLDGPPPADDPGTGGERREGFPGERGLRVPVAHADHIVGTLYLAHKEGGSAFSAEDHHLLTLLAAHAAIVIENARLAEQVRTLAVGAERERIGRDLHDGVIQAIFAINLELEDMAEDVESDPARARVRIDAAIDRLGAVITSIRRYITGLQTEEDGPSIADALAGIVADARIHTLIEPQVHIDGAALERIAPELAQELLQVAREAVTNVVRHARASRLWLTLRVEGDEAHLRVADNGVGFDAAGAVPHGHQGLHNMAERARRLGGVLTVTSAPEGGTVIDLRVPVAIAREVQRV